MSPGALLPLGVVLPLVGGTLAPLLSRLAGWLGVAVPLLSTVAAFVVLARFAPAAYSGRVVVADLGGWGPVAGTQLGVTLAADPLGLTFALLATGVGAVLLLYSLSELGGLGRKELGGYTCLFQLLVAALVGSALTADLLNLFVWFEVAALASYGLTGFSLERPHAVEAAFKIAVLTNLASFCVLVAVVLLYAGHGAFQYGQLHASLAGGLRTPDLVALGLLVLGLGTKAGLVPFHGWLPDAHSAAPGPVSALFSGVMVGLGVLGLARVVLDVYGLQASGARTVLMVLGGTGAVGGALLALAQDDLKRLLAYDTVSQVGILAMATGVGSAQSLVGMVYHLLDHGLFKALLFLCAGAVVHATGLTRLSQLGSLARQRPVVTGAFVVGVLAVAGVPPLNGYVSLGLVHAAVEHGHPVALATLTLAQVLTVAALTRATYLAFFRRRDEAYERVERMRPGMLVAFAVLALACVGFGVLAGPVLRHLVQPAAASLTDGTAYAAATLAGGGTLAVPGVERSYLEPSALLTLGGTALLGVLLAVVVVRRPGLLERPPVSWLRALHTGSVNDYAAYAVLGLVVCTGGLLLV